MAQLIADYRYRSSLDPRFQQQTPLPSLLGSLLTSPPLPDWTPAQWIAILHAPQASQRVSHSAAERGMAGAAVIERPEVARLLIWVHSTWPGSLRAMAGALAAARQVQTTQPADLAGAATYVIDEIRRSRSRRGRRTTTRSRVVPMDPAKLRAVEPPPTPPVAPSRVADALAWMLGFADADVRLPLATRLDIEASISLFLGWYVDRLAQPPAGTQIVPIPPSRSLSPRQRLSARLADRDLVSLLAGPPGSRRCPTERAWQQGMGYWAIVVLLCWARGTEPSEPPPEARQWWSCHLRVLAARPQHPRPPAAVASTATAAETVPQAM
ncbi:MAG: hypothetical protein M0Z95_21930 [Actinomycetota bacterium]|nr:hypothetical protein [Actinomycetota bacterium]